MIYLIISLIIGVSASTLVWAIFLLEKDLSPNVLRRLDRIKRKSNINELVDDKSEELDLSKQESDYQFPFMESIFLDSGLSKSIKDLIQNSDFNIKIDVFILLSLACASICLIFLFTPYKLMSLFCVFTLFVPTVYLNHLVGKRFLEFSKQFPDALNLMASSLRAGHPLFSAFEIVTSEMPKPISDVFQTVQRDISLGIDTKDAFYSMMKVMPNSLDLRFFITAVLIQKEVGGNLAELLNSLSATIRERFKLMGQLRVQTAQTRISGIVLGLVPILVLLAIFFLNPEYIKPLFETPDGKIAFGVAVMLIVSGFLAMKKISNIEM